MVHIMVYLNTSLIILSYLFDILWIRSGTLCMMVYAMLPTLMDRMHVMTMDGMPLYMMHDDEYDDSFT